MSQRRAAISVGDAMAARPDLWREADRQAGLDYLAATGVTTSPAGIARAGQARRRAAAGMSPQAWRALAKGPDAYRAWMASQTGPAVA